MGCSSSKTLRAMGGGNPARVYAVQGSAVAQPTREDIVAELFQGFSFEPSDHELFIRLNRDLLDSLHAIKMRDQGRFHLILTAIIPLLYVANRPVATQAERKESEAANNFLRYLRGLSIDHQHIALQFFTGSGQKWQLKPETLDLLNEILSAGEEYFLQLIAVIQTMCNTEGLIINAAHIDDVMAALRMQRDLVSELDITKLLEITTNASGESQQEVVLQGLRVLREQKHVELDKITAANQVSPTGELPKLLIHHSLPHAAEMMHRTLTMCKALLPDFIADDLIHAFVGFMTEFHDFEQQQGSPVSETNEQLTLKWILQWVKDEAHGLRAVLRGKLEEEKIIQLEKLIEFIAHRLIVIATTMVFGAYNTDEAMILFRFQEVLAEVSSLRIAEVKRNRFIQNSNVAAITAGLCDRSPAAVKLIAEQQYSVLDTKTEAIVRATLGQEVTTAGAAAAAASTEKQLALDLFFNSDRFQSYYADSTLEINKQAFLLTLASNVGMCMELVYAFGDAGDTSSQKRFKQNMAKVFVEFINNCRSDDRNPGEGAAVCFFDAEVLMTPSANALKIPKSLLYTGSRTISQSRFS